MSLRPKARSVIFRTSADVRGCLVAFSTGFGLGVKGIRCNSSRSFALMSCNSPFNPFAVIASCFNRTISPSLLEDFKAMVHAVRHPHAATAVNTRIAQLRTKMVTVCQTMRSPSSCCFEGPTSVKQCSSRSGSRPATHRNIPLCELPAVPDFSDSSYSYTNT